MNTEFDLNLDASCEKDNIEIKLNNIPEKDDSNFPEHIPLISYNVQKEREKEETRKLAKKLRKSAGNIEPIVVTKAGVIKKVSELTVEEQEDEIVRCASNPIYFIETYLTIFDQTQGIAGMIVPFKLFDFQRDLIKSYQDYRFVVANKYRQAGISTTTCAYIAWYVMFNRNRQVAIVADKLETATGELMSDVVDFIESCPAWLRPKTGRNTEKNLKDTQKLKIYDNESKLGAFASKSLRGYTPTLLFWDETAWAEKGDKFWTAALPSLVTGGRAIMVSCVTKDTFIYTDNGIKQIKDFIPNEILGAHVIDEYNVLGKNKLRKGNLFFNNGFVDTLKVKTTFSELESSYNHKYWAYKVKNNKYCWSKASELEINDYVSIQYGMNIWGENNDCLDFKPTSSSKIKNVFKPTKITEDIAYLIGLYISEGCGNKKNNRPRQYYGITITCGDDMTQVLENLNLKYHNKDEMHYVIGSLNVSEFFEYLGFDLSKKANEKIIPSRLLEMSKENIIAMIQGIMDGDGWSTFKKNNSVAIGIRLSSKELIDQLRILFGNFGILTDYRDSITPPTKLVKVESRGYCITATNSFAIKYFNEIGFRFNRKQIKGTYFESIKQKHSGVVDNIPNGKEMMVEIYNEIKYYGKLKELQSKGIKIESWINRKKQYSLPSSRQTLLKIIELEKNNISDKLLNNINSIISNNIYWTKIKSIEKSQNYTYDFSLPNDPQEEYDFHHSVVYNQMITHQTPSGLDAVFYKTFMGARDIDENGRSKNNFHAVELWWYDDPRYNKDLHWVKNKDKENEIKIEDNGRSQEQRSQLVKDGWIASNEWFDEQIRNANGDMRKVAQELLCVFGKALLTIKNKKTGEIENITIEDLYEKLKEQNNSSEFLYKSKYMNKIKLINKILTINIEKYRIKGGLSMFNKDFPNLINEINTYTNDMQICLINKTLYAKLLYLKKYYGNINKIIKNDKILVFDRISGDFIEKSNNSTKKHWDEINKLIKNCNNFYSKKETIKLLENNYKNYLGKSGNRKLISKDIKLYCSVFYHTKYMDLLDKNLNKFSSRLIILINNINIYCDKHNKLKHWKFNKNNEFIIGCAQCEPKYPSVKWFKLKFGNDWIKYYEIRKETVKKNKTNSLEWFIRKYGNIGVNKYNEYVVTKMEILSKLKANRYSKISQELFWILYHLIPDTNDTYFHDLNNEYVIKIPEKYNHENIIMMLDFKYKNKIIEYNGNYWHNTEKDKIRYSILNEMGYQTLIITSDDFNRNKKPKEIIDKCLKFLTC
jgi:hypothetical protein